MNSDGTYYALRYVTGVPINQRKHAATLGRWDDFGDAEDARVLRPGAQLLEVVKREGR